MSAEPKPRKPKMSLGEAGQRIAQLIKDKESLQTDLASANQRAEAAEAALRNAVEQAHDAGKAPPTAASAATVASSTAKDEQLARLEKALYAANKRADKEEAFHITLQERAQVTETGLAKAKIILESQTKILHDTERELADKNVQVLMMRAGRDKELQELKDLVNTRDEEIGKMSLSIVRLIRDKQQAERLAKLAQERVTVLHNRLDATIKGVEHPLKRVRDDSDDILEPTSSTTVTAGTSSALPDTKKARLRSPCKVVPCTQCFTKGWPCDNGEGGGTCRNCQLRGKSAMCKRVACKSWKGNACKNVGCTFAHEDDGFRRIVSHTLLKAKPAGLSPVQREKQDAKDKKE